MPNVTFTLADNGQGPMSLRFAPRTLHTSGGEIVTPVPKPGWQTFARGVEHTIDLDEGPWQVHGLGGRNSGSIEPFDVGPTGGDLRALIAFGVPEDAPGTKLAAAAASWMDENVDPSVTGPLVEGVLTDPESPARAVLTTTVTNTMANDVVIAAAAEAAVDGEVTGRDLVQGADPRLAREYGVESATAYVDITLDQSDRFVGGTRADGTHEVAGLMIAGDSSVTTNIETEGISYTPFVDKSGRLPEGHLDGSGQIPQYTLDAWAQRMNGGTGQPIWLIHSMGQSNAVRSDSLPVSIADSDPRILQWNGTEWITHPVAATQFEYLAYFLARHLIQSGKLPPGTRIGIVQHAVGSTGFSSTDEVSPPAGRNYSAGGTWDRSYGGSTINLYTQFRTRALAALAASPAGSAHYLAIWSQGEQDRSYRTQSTYAANLDDLIGQARTDLGVADLPFLIGSMTPSTIAANVGDTVGIDRAHEDTPRRVVRTAFIRGPLGMDKHDETIHYSSQAQMARAPMFARALDTARLNVAAAKPLPPQNLRVTRSGNTATITWDHPDSRVTAFTIATSIDAGSNWTPVTLPIAIAHTATVTVDPAVALWVRGSSTNEVGTSYNTEVRA